jgi:hypothetical protein
MCTLKHIRALLEIVSITHVEGSNLVTKKQGEKMIGEIVQRFNFVDKNKHLIKERLLSEQDITTKFVLL